MVNWGGLLGLPLETALAKVRASGVEPEVLIACAPRRKGQEELETREGTLRVIRAREGELTVSAFQDGDPKKE